MMKNERVRAGILVTISGCLYGFLGYLGTKIIEQDVSISMMLFWRFAIAGLWMLALYSIDHLKNSNHSNIDKKSFLFVFIFSALGYSGASGFFFMASKYTGTGIAMVIFFSYPILVALTSWLIHKHKLSLKTGLVLIAISLGLVLLDDSSHKSASLFGIFLAVLSSISYAFYIIGTKKYCSLNINSKLLTTIVCLACSVVFIFLAALDHSISIPNSLVTWGYILALGILATALPIQLMLDGLKHISSLRASIISVLEPVVTVILGVLLLNESISSWQYLGIVIVLSSAILVQFQREL